MRSPLSLVTPDAPAPTAANCKAKLRLTSAAIPANKCHIRFRIVAKIIVICPSVSLRWYLLVLSCRGPTHRSAPTRKRPSLHSFRTCAHDLGRDQRLRARSQETGCAKDGHGVRQPPIAAAVGIGD